MPMLVKSSEYLCSHGTTVISMLPKIRWPLEPHSSEVEGIAVEEVGTL